MGSTSKFYLSTFLGLCLLTQAAWSQFGSGIQGTIATAAYPVGDYNADGTNYNRPNAPPSSVARSGFSKQDFLRGIFKVSDSPVPARGSVGTLGRNAFRGSGLARVDLALSKDLRLAERLGYNLRVESSNAFNRVNLNAPNTNLTNNNFGKTISASDARTYTVSLPVSF